MNITNAKNRLLQEIKINKPGNIFKVTDKGKEYVNDFVILERLSEKFGCGELLKNEGGESELYSVPQLLYIFSDTFGEGIISMDGLNKIDEYIQKYTNIWEPEEINGLKVLKNFEKFGFITKIII
jgi:DNA-binding PadR family transcriptional regulator